MVVADISFLRHDPGLTIQAYVGADAGQPVEWTLKVVSRTAGGDSTTSQAGRASGPASRPVSSVSLASGAHGRAVLVVRGAR